MGEWDGLVVFCAGQSWDAVRLHDQHIAERLARYAPVLYVDPPISHLTPWRRPDLAASLKRPRLRQLAPRLARLTPVVLPGKTRPGMSVISTALTRRSVRRAAGVLGGSVHAVVVSSLLNLFGACGETRRALYAADDFVGGADLFGVSATRLARAERRRMIEVDIVIAGSEVVADRWRAFGHHPILVPHGVDDQHFASVDSAPLSADVTLPSPVVGLIGHLNDRIDLSLLEAVAERGRSLLLIGPRGVESDARRLDRLLGRPNVQWLGPRPFAGLPSYLRAIDVGIVPYRDTAFNRASFPLKTLEYLAAGRPAVATDLPAIRWLNTDLIEVATGPAAFADAVDRALSAPRPPELVARRRALASQHSWDRRAATFAGALGLVAS